MDMSKAVRWFLSGNSLNMTIYWELYSELTDPPMSSGQFQDRKKKYKKKKGKKYKLS